MPLPSRVSPSVAPVSRALVRASCAPVRARRAGRRVSAVVSPAGVVRPLASRFSVPLLCAGVLASRVLPWVSLRSLVSARASASPSALRAQARFWATLA